MTEKTDTMEKAEDKKTETRSPLAGLILDLVDQVNVNSGSFVEILQGALGPDKGEHFRYIKREPHERLSFVVTRTSRPEVYKALRLGLLLHGYTAMLRRVNDRLPPPEPEEDPTTWALPLTSIRPYLLDQVLSLIHI